MSDVKMKTGCVRRVSGVAKLLNEMPERPDPANQFQMPTQQHVRAGDLLQTLSEIDQHLQSIDEKLGVIVERWMGGGA